MWGSRRRSSRNREQRYCSACSVAARTSKKAGISVVPTAHALEGLPNTRRDAAFFEPSVPPRYSHRASESPDHQDQTRELIMKKIMSSLIALSVLAGVATSVGAQTREDEERGDFWKYQERNLP